MLPPRPKPPSSRKEDLRELQAQVIQNAPQVAVGVLDFVLGVALGPLPERWRGGWVHRYSPDFNSASFVSGLAQFFACLGLWGGGMILWMHAQSEAIAETAEKLGSNRDDSVMAGHAMLGMNPFMTLIYTLTTPHGFLTAIFAAGGLFRLVSLGVWRENAADPTLSVIDALIREAMGKVKRKRRDVSKGMPVPDQLLSGDGSRHDLRVVSREDYPWPVGVSVLLEGTTYRVVAKGETRDAQGHLRLQYDLKELGPTEVMRGIRRYAPTLRPRDERGRT